MNDTAVERRRRSRERSTQPVAERRACEGHRALRAAHAGGDLVDQHMLRAARPCAGAGPSRVAPFPADREHGMSRLSVAEKLRIAGASAPALRRTERVRIVNLVDSNGRVVGQVDHVTVAKKLHERIGIEFDVDPSDRREKVRKCKCGNVFVLPPKRDWKDHAGRLPTRCVECRNAVCRVCGAEATEASRKNGTRKTAVCAAHVSTGPSCQKPVPPCVMCGAPAHSPAKARFAASKGRPVYCEEHRGGPATALTPKTCEVCGKSLSVQTARFCNEHKYEQRRKPRLPCSVCGAPSTQSASARTRIGRSLPYCEEHKGGTGRGQFRKGENSRATEKRSDG